jgi:hypothetical protein
MNTDFISAVASMGIGAVFGVIIFVIYRIDRKASEERYAELCGSMEQRLATLLERDTQTREENTKALQELITLVSRLNGHHT